MFEYLFAFYPALAVYRFGLGLDSVLLLIFAINLLMHYQGVLKINEDNKPYLILFIYIILKDIVIIAIGPSDTSESFHKFLATGAYIVSFLILTSYRFDHEKFYRALKITGSIYIAGLIYHLFVIYVLGGKATTLSIIPGLQVGNMNELNRPRSFF